MSDFDVLASDLDLLGRRDDMAVQSLLMGSAQAMGQDMTANAPSRRVAGSVSVRKARKEGVIVGPTHPLGHLFEFGTGPRTQTSTGRYTGIMSPRPFVWPAVDRELPNLLRNIERQVGRL